MHPSPRALAIRAWTDRITLGIIAFVVGLELFAVLGFIVRAPISPVTTLLAALAAAGAVAFSLRRRSDWVWRTCLIVGICAVVIVAACALAGRFYDVSFDGQAYQGSAVLRFAAGWNPLADVEGATLTGPHIIWHAHFPKGPGWRTPAIFKLIGHIEPAKGLTIALACAVFAFCLGVFASFESMPVALAAVFALLAAFNPVVILQSFTLYIDARVSAWLTILIIALLDMALRADADWLTSTIAGLAAAAALNMKFTATGFVARAASRRGDHHLLAGRSAAILEGCRRHRRLDARRLACTGLESICDEHARSRHPLHPAMGREARRIVNDVIIPGRFRGGRSARSSVPLGLRRVRRPDHPSDEPAQDPLHHPGFRMGAVRLRGPTSGCARAALRRGGVARACDAGVLAPDRGWASPLVKVMLQVLGVVAITVVMSPDAWWVRYNPQLWLIPLLLAAMPFMLPRNVVARTMGALTCAVLAADVVFVGVASVRAQLYYTGKVKAELAQLSARKQPIPIYFELMGSNGQRLKEAGIRYTVLDREAGRGRSAVPFRLGGRSLGRCAT